MTQCTLELSGSALKEIGMQRALDHAGESWTEETMQALREFCARLKSEGIHTLMMEDFRCTRYKALPPSSNAWGAFTSIAARRGIIRFSGDYRPTKSPKTHGHPAKVWNIL